MENVVFIGAHPDDFTGCCGTALLMRGKFNLHIWDFTKGERGLQQFGVSMDECAATREKEEENVAAYMGAQLAFLGQIDGDFYATKECCTKLAEMLRELKPRAVFTHSVADRHGDHMMAGTAVLKALQLAGLQPEIYTFEFLHQSRIFIPRFFTDITPVMDEKIKIIRMYECQNKKDGMVEMNKKRASFRGWQIHAEHAEAFGAYDYMQNGDRNIFSEI